MSIVTRDWYLSQRFAWSEKLTKDLEYLNILSIFAAE